MKRILSVIIIYLLLACSIPNTPSGKSDAQDANDSRKIGLYKLAGSSIGESAKMIVIEDTIILINDSLATGAGKYNYSRIYFDRNANQFRYQFLLRSTISQGSLTMLETKQPLAILKKSSNYKDAKMYLPLKINDSISFDTNNKFFDDFAGKTYYIAKEFPKWVYVLNKVEMSLDSFRLPITVMGVENLLLFDIDKDNNPEMFISHKGMIANDSIVSYDFLSFRKDSATIIFK